MKRRIKFQLMTATIVLLIALVGGSFYMIEYSLRRHLPDKFSRETRFTHVVSGNPEIKPWVDSLQKYKLIHDTIVKMQNNERQHAMFVYANLPTTKTAVLLHGYHDNGTKMMQIAHIYAQMGYNLMIPDHHAHGESEGKMIQMGWKERFDVLRWMTIADSLFSDSIGHSQQVVHGVSMGAALTMCVSGENTPDYVKCFVEDCGYTSVWDEFTNQLKAQFGLPPFPLLYCASGLNKLIYGWSFGEASPLKQVAKCHKPMLFIHGDNDNYVASKMVFPLYKAKPGIKQLWIAKGSAHALSYHDHRQEYADIVKKFVSRNISSSHSVHRSVSPSARH